MQYTVVHRRAFFGRQYCGKGHTRRLIYAIAATRGRVHRGCSKIALPQHGKLSQFRPAARMPPEQYQLAHHAGAACGRPVSEPGHEYSWLAHEMRTAT